MKNTTFLKILIVVANTAVYFAIAHYFSLRLALFIMLAIAANNFEIRILALIKAIKKHGE